MNAKTEVKQQLENRKQAVISQNIKQIIGCYADDVRAFDAIAELQFTPRSNYQTYWQSCLEMCKMTKFEIGQLDIKADADTEAGIMPSEALLSAMRHYNMQLAQAGVLKAGEGQKPSRDGARIKFQQSKPLITDGPFTETKELLAGFYLLDARDINEAIQLAGNIPPARYGSIEIRPVRELQTE